MPRRLCTLCVSWDFDYLFFLRGKQEIPLKVNKKFKLPCLVATLIQVLKGIRSGSWSPWCVVLQPHSADH